jgi:hypothetical protein
MVWRLAATEKWPPRFTRSESTKSEKRKVKSKPYWNKKWSNNSTEQMRWGGGRGSPELYKGCQSGVDGRVTSLMWMWRRQRTRGSTAAGYLAPTWALFYATRGLGLEPRQYSSIQTKPYAFVCLADLSRT